MALTCLSACGMWRKKMPAMIRMLESNASQKSWLPWRFVKLVSFPNWQTRLQEAQDLLVKTQQIFEELQCDDLQVENLTTMFTTNMADIKTFFNHLEQIEPLLLDIAFGSH
jgi:hypothetical protein